MKWKHTDLFKGRAYISPPPTTPPDSSTLKAASLLKVFMYASPPAVPSVCCSYLTAAFAHVGSSSQNALSPCLPGKLLAIPQDPAQASLSLCSLLSPFPHVSRADHRIFCIPTDLEYKCITYSSHRLRLCLEQSGPQISFVL